MLDFLLNLLSGFYEKLKEDSVIIIVIALIAIAMAILLFYIKYKEEQIKESFNENKIIYFKNKNEIIELSKANGWILKNGYFKKDDRLIKIEDNGDNLSLNIP